MGCIVIPWYPLRIDCLWLRGLGPVGWPVHISAVLTTKCRFESREDLLYVPYSVLELRFLTLSVYGLFKRIGRSSFAENFKL